MDVADQTSAPNTQWTVVISHDNYQTSVGGVQRLVAEDLEAMTPKTNTLHVCPADSATLDGASSSLQVSANMAPHIPMMESEVVSLIEGIPPSELTVVIHHAMGLSTVFLERALRASTPTRRFIWVHDFYTLCESFALMRNDETYCAGPSSESEMCNSCTYGRSRRKDHEFRMRKLLATPGTQLIFPSEWARDFWQSRSLSSTSETHIAPPTRLLNLGDREAIISESVLRVAFLGSAAAHKGWRAFETIARLLAGDGTFLFYQMSTHPGPASVPHIQHVPVTSSLTSPWAMVDALTEHRIDAAYCYSVGTETFGFTFYEAIAAGCLPIIRRGGGNPYEQSLRVPDISVASYESERQLTEAFLSNEIASMIRRRVERKYFFLEPVTPRERVELYT